MNNVIKITGLDCANCARELEEEIEQIDGVKSASVDFMAQKVYAECDGATLEKVKECCNNFEEVKVVEEENADGEKLKIKGLCCANCARELEEDLNKIEGVNARVDFINSKIILNAISPDARKKAIHTITHFDDVKIVDGVNKNKGVIKSHLKDIICILVSLVLFIPAFVLDITGVAERNLATKIITYSFFGIAYISVGYKVLNHRKKYNKGQNFRRKFPYDGGFGRRDTFGDFRGRRLCRRRCRNALVPDRRAVAVGRRRFVKKFDFRVNGLKERQRNFA